MRRGRCSFPHAMADGSGSEDQGSKRAELSAIVNLNGCAKTSSEGENLMGPITRMWSIFVLVVATMTTIVGQTSDEFHHVVIQPNDMKWLKNPTQSGPLTT